MSLEKEFVSYELAVKLQEFGFDEECLKWYDNNGEFVKRLTQDFCCKAPLWQQAFDWFRETHGLHGDIYRNGTKYLFVIEDMTLGNSIDSCDIPMEYEESRLACLEKLIELTTCKSEN